MLKLNSQSGRVRPDFFCLLALAIAVIQAPALAQTPSKPPPRVVYEAPAATTGQQPPLPRTTIEVGSRRITVEIAATNTARAQGLMFREALDSNHGMLFVFPEPAHQCFWMKNTPLPLSIAFINDKGVITSLADMEPYSLDDHCTVEPALHALEMEQGWFADHGIQPGTVVKGLPRLKRRAH